MILTAGVTKKVTMNLARTAAPERQLRAFDHAFSALHMQVMELGGLVLGQVRDAVHAYLEADQRRARLVIDRASSVRDYQQRVHEAELALLVRHQPLASDLRSVFDLRHAALELVHAGGEGPKIAFVVVDPESRPRRVEFPELRRFGAEAIALLRRSLEAVDHLDSEPSFLAIARDRTITADHVGLLHSLATRASKVPTDMRAAIDAASVLAALEGVIDHARTLLTLGQRRRRAT